MPLGDSITDIVCWRAYLWDRLQNTGYANVDFVGSVRGERPGGCDVPGYDKDNEGHSGLLAVHTVALNLLPTWLRQNPPDIVTMHLGSNDIGHGYKIEQILHAFSKLVGQMRDANPRMKIIVAQILPLYAIGFEAKVLELNSRIPLWAKSMSTSESPIIVVDQHSGFGLADFRDGVHPNDAGDKKMAENWYPALVAAVHAVQTGRERGGLQEQLGHERQLLYEESKRRKGA
ncbi:uncharacterized protein PV09_04991 [Verruconis gallopava]|uniref:SGNH hydrolase-type esterase domain-containing protein n=1 Tax=Verruconis gallopava TaxID=253628 RepID=A0A0D2AAQ5_9PEZI|nr:uncharacterized protein PV09_04991 [Verruconis gallopava]KIW03670.1 hypothetical protein PV09_04991 [Verruconis gallopava]